MRSTGQWRAAVAAAWLMGLAGCVATPTAGNLVAPGTPAQPPAPIDHAIEVGKVGGADSFNAMDLVKVDVTEAELRTAIDLSLNHRGLAGPSNGATRYRLDVSLTGLVVERGLFAAFEGVKVTSTIDYRLEPLKGGDPFRTSVTRTTAGPMGAPWEVGRAVSEASIRKNIGEYMDQLTAHFATTPHSGA